MASLVPTRRGARFALAVAAIIAVAAPVAVGAAQSSNSSLGEHHTAQPGRVGVAGTALTLDGKPWWPIGLNAYQLASNWSVNRGCGAQVNLDSYFAALPPNSVTRFDAFESLATNVATGRRDWSAIDAVFAAAERHAQMLVPVLTAHDGACENEREKDHDWYAAGWRSETHGLEPSFSGWITDVVTRYRDSRALVAWEAVGEPEPVTCADAGCVEAGRTCPLDAAQVLRTFLDQSGADIRSLDPGSLITAGLTGGGQCGSAGLDYQYVNDSPNVDVLQYHDYGADGVPLPGDQWNGLAARLGQARVLQKPLVVGEIGEYAGGPGCVSLDERAANVDAKLQGQRAAGTAGAMLWSFVPDPRPGQCTYDIGPGDPLIGMLGEYPSGPA